MSIQELYNTVLKQVTPDGTLAITSTLLNSASITHIFSLYGIDTITLTGVKVGAIDPDTNSFPVTGTGTAITLNTGALPGLTGAPNATFSVSGNEAQLALTLPLPAGWTFGTSFTDIQGSFIDKLPITPQQATLSSLPQTGVQPATEILPGFYFTGSLSLGKGSFSALALLFNTAEIAVGAFIMGIAPTYLDVKTAFFPDISLQKAGFKTAFLDINNTLLPLIIPDTGEVAQTPTTTVDFSGKLYLSDTITVDVSAIYPFLSHIVTLKGTIENGITLTNGLQDLASLFGASDLVGKLPQSLQDFGNNIALEEVELGFSLDDPANIFSAKAGLTITHPFTLFPGLSIAQVEALNFTWSVYNPFNSATRAIYFYSDCQVLLGNKYPVNLIISESINAGFSLNITSVEGSPLNLAGLLSDFGIPASYLPALSVSQFQFSADIGSGSYGLYLSAGAKWTPFDGLSIDLEDAFFECSYTKGGSPPVTANASATFALPSAGFTIAGSKDSGWTFNGQLETTAPSLGDLLTDLAQQWGINTEIPSFLDDITIYDVSFLFATDPLTFTFTLDTALTILGVELEVDLGIAIQKTGDSYDKTLSGSLYLAGETFTLTFSSNPEDTSFTASWTAAPGHPLTINDILSELNLDAIQIPDGLNFDLGLTSAQLRYDTGKELVSLNVTTAGGFDAFFEMVAGGNGKNFCFALSLNENFSLSSLSSSLSLFDALTFTGMAVVFANFTDKNFQVPNLPFTGVVDGMEFRAMLTVKPSQNSDPNSGIVKIIQYLENCFGNAQIIIGLNLSTSLSDFELVGQINGPFSFPYISSVMLEGISLSIKIDPVYVDLTCTLGIPIDFKSDPPVKQLDLSGGIYFDITSDGDAEIGATLSESTSISYPFGIPLITLNSLGVGMAGAIGANSKVNFTLTGGFALGSKTSTKKIQEDFGATIEFDVDTELPNVPYIYNKTEMNNLTFQDIWNAVFPEQNFPDFLNGFQLSELMFYFCDESQVLPDGTTINVGASFLAATTIWNFSSFINLVIQPQNLKIAGEADIDPITINSPYGNKSQIVSITGSGKGSTTYNIQPGGAFFNFDTSTLSFSASLNAQILGFTEVINASISTSGLSIAFTNKIAGISDEQVTILFTDPLHMSFSCSLSVSLNFTLDVTIDNTDFGQISINNSLTGSINIGVNGLGNYTAVVNGSFKWNDNYPPITLNSSDIAQYLDDLSNLEGALIAYIKDNVSTLFADAFGDAKTYIGYVMNGVITGGDFILNVLDSFYKHTIDELISDIAGMTNGFHLSGDLDFHMDVSQNVPSYGFHANVGHFNHSALIAHANIDIGASFSTPSFEVSLLNIGANDHFDYTVPPQVHANGSAFVNVGVHLDWHDVPGSGSVSADGEVGVSTTAGLSGVTFNPHLDANAKGGYGAFGIHVNLPAHINTNL